MAAPENTKKPSPPATAMVLAAGLGLRMRPLTLDQPKALISLAGKPLIDHVLEALARAGVKRAVVNVHHQAEPLVLHLDRKSAPAEILISDEQKQLLETGGGVAKALPELGAKPFFAANCDSFFPDALNNPFSFLARAWDGKKMDALLLVAARERAHSFKGPGDFFREPDGRLARRGDQAHAPFVFTGVQILKPELFEADDPAVFSLNRTYDRALARGTLFGTIYPGPWFHIGAPADLAPAEVFVAKRTGGG
jgi:N-acetyl-alpha-D-muramate 1-phosphate uridylyltransferase